VHDSFPSVSLPDGKLSGLMTWDGRETTETEMALK